jgi:hypothetical protein
LVRGLPDPLAIYLEVSSVSFLEDFRSHWWLLNNSILIHDGGKCDMFDFIQVIPVDPGALEPSSYCQWIMTCAEMRKCLNFDSLFAKEIGSSIKRVNHLSRHCHNSPICAYISVLTLRRQSLQRANYLMILSCTQIKELQRLAWSVLCQILNLVSPPEGGIVFCKVFARSSF